MGNSKKGLNNRILIVNNPNTDEEFKVFVTFSWYNEPIDDNETIGALTREDIDIKQIESDSDIDLPHWVTEDLVYESLFTELEIESDEEEEFNFEDTDDDDYLDDLISEDDDENW